MKKNNDDEKIIDLLPGGQFLFYMPDGKPVKGRFSMFTLDRFSTDSGLLNYLQLATKITLAMTIREYAKLVLYALQDYYRNDYSQCTVVIDGKTEAWTEELVMEQLFDRLGLGNNQLLGLFKHAVGRVTQFKEEPTDTDAGKKKPVKQQPKRKTRSY